jgi:nitrogen regulatory protein PII
VKEEKTEKIEETENKPEQVPSKKKRKRKRKRKKKKKKINSDDERLEEQKKQNEKIVNTFWENNPNQSIYSYEEYHERYDDLLKIDPKKLNYVKEMNKLFNNQQFSVTKTVNPGWSKKQMNMHREYMKKFRPKRKYYLIYNDDVKLKLNDKLSMKEMRNDLGHKCKFFIFFAKGKLASLAETYKQVKNTNDIGSTMDFLHTNPYYPEALYDLGEYQRLQGNFKEANLMLEKMLFLYEDSLEFAFRVFESNISITKTKGNHLMIF